MKTKTSKKSVAVKGPTKVQRDGKKAVLKEVKAYLAGLAKFQKKALTILDKLENSDACDRKFAEKVAGMADTLHDEHAQFGCNIAGVAGEWLVTFEDLNLSSF